MGDERGDKVELRPVGRIEFMTSGWRGAGSNKTTSWTSNYESCIGMSTVWGEGDTQETTLLDKCAPPTVHCVLRPHLENIWDLWIFLKEKVMGRTHD